MITITASVVTLGCRLNQADSALLCDRLRRCGFQIVDEDYEESPNVIIVNSCTVTATAARKTRQLLTSIRHRHPYAYIILTGCAAEVDKESFMDSSDCESASNRGGKLEAILETPLTIFSRNPFQTVRKSSDPLIFKKTRWLIFRSKGANLKISEGCNNLLFLLHLPVARGGERSRNAEGSNGGFPAASGRGFGRLS